MSFKKIYIEISDICSCKCSFCPSPMRVERRGVMSLALFERVLTQIKPLCKRICLHVLGDPLEVKNFKDYADLVAKFGLEIDLVTTGKNLKKDSFALLSSPPFHQISLSLSAFFDENNHFKEDFISNLLAFCNYSVAQKSDVFVNLRVQSEFLLNQNPKMLELFDCLQSHFGLNLQPNLDEIKANFQSQIYPKNTKIRLARKVLLNFKTSFNWKNEDANSSQKRCHALTHQLAILSDGTVVPCCIDCFGVINLGDIKSSNLNEILNSKRALDIKNGFLNGVATEPHCHKCTYPIGVS
ncbi:radical SAM superfamily enzyme (SPASM domain) [Campylobacter iguaniorum]|uniref:radical SAM/SPASM domain-containing protein n=1 Tax=Campylobacter iguaniorum TaxID=1244531 RepID=UPI0007C8FDD5|nr:radical SAM/SPASM domain-containing protein [Campylobacter iguaniorum]ANE36548.1 radical SAM superfamily enzyme (SPASM domain) [Campylobacter iguaniorum]